MSKHQTDIISKEDICKYLKDNGIDNPMDILEEAIKFKVSIYIPKLKSTLAWIYKGEVPWNIHGSNSNNVNDYNYQIMPH